MPNSELSIVIPTLDTCELTLCCLRSIGSQDRPPAVEVIVIDDGSQDGTADRIRRDYPETHVLTHESPQGFTRSANRGLSRAEGSLVLLLNSDTEVRPGALAALRTAFDQDPSLGIAGGTLFYPGGRRQWSGGSRPSWSWFFWAATGLGELLNRWPRLRTLRPVRGHRSSVEWVTGAALAVRREVLDHVGLLDEQFKLYAQDLDFCLRATEHGWTVRVLEDCRVLHHHGATVVHTKVGGTVERHHAALKWADLLRWANKNHSPGWVSVAACLAAAGLLLRAGSLRLKSLTSRSDDQPQLQMQARLLGRLSLSLLRHRHQFPTKTR